jgi:hypothetical protein
MGPHPRYTRLGKMSGRAFRALLFRDPSIMFRLRSLGGRGGSREGRRGGERHVAQQEC